MAHPSRRDVQSCPFFGAIVLSPTSLDTDLAWPFGRLDSIDRDDIRETAYEIFFTACRSSPGFGGRNALTFYSSHNQSNAGDGAPTSPSGRVTGVVITTPTSKVKRALGLKMLKRSPSRRMSAVGCSNGGGSTPSSPVGHGSSSPNAFSTVPASRPRRPLTSAEIMRQQMGVTEQSDNRLRKTLMRTLVGQMGRRAETIILPLELLRQLKPSEFNDSREYHAWQKRQLKVLEVGLLQHPSIPLDKSNTFAIRLREIIRSAEIRPMDTGKNSDMMRTLCNSVVSLSWRSTDGSATDVCHWADGFPLNIHLYVSLLQSIFDFRDETLVLDEVDELLELMKKTWSTLGITRQIHNVCFTWVLFHQYVSTGQVEPDLLCASYAMITEVSNDAKKPDREAAYVKLLTALSTSMQSWAERRLLNYHDYFQRGSTSGIENLLPLALSATKILGDEDSTGDRVDYYIRSSVRNAFESMMENERMRGRDTRYDADDALIQLAQQTEDLALREREIFSPILKQWHPIASGTATVTLHQCYGGILKQYLTGTATLSSEVVGVLQRAGKLENSLVQMVVEDSADCEDGGKGVVREMVPYEVDSIIMKLLGGRIEDSMKKGRELLVRAEETETWNPKSKSEPYAQSGVALIRLVKETVGDFFDIPIGITDDLVMDLAEGLEQLLQEYCTFVASCGSKQSYIPTLPPLTRCNRASTLAKLWKKAAPCSVGAEDMMMKPVVGESEGQQPRPSTSRGTQRLYIRLNTLHYLLSHLHPLEKTLSASPNSSSRSRPGGGSGRRRRSRGNVSSSSYFEQAHSSIQSACNHVSDVAAYRLIFLDSSSVFYEDLYIVDVSNSRIKPALRILKQNLTLLTAILTDRAQAVAMRQVMKASFEAFLMVLLAGGSNRIFQRSDHEMIQEDFDSLKKVFCTCGEGLISEDVVEREAENVEGVISLLGQTTEQLVEDFSIITCETSGIGILAEGQKLPMPPTTGRWNRADPNTILRVLCHRNDRAANLFLKRSFQLAKRRH